MKKLFLFVFIFGLLSISGLGQTVVINDPAVELKSLANTNVENLIKTKVLPKVRKHWTSENSPCEETFEMSGVVKGSFSKANANQTVAFYSFCQTGNGLGTMV